MLGEKLKQFVHCDDCGHMVAFEETKFVTLPHDHYERRWCLCHHCGKKRCEEASMNWDEVV